jgi:hypothetical protein
VAEKGPDWLFIAQVRPECAGDLAAIAARAAPAGFVPCADGDDAITFIDADNLAAYTRNLTGERPQNIWIYNMVQVRGDTVTVECGYGGRGAALNHAETAFLLDLLAAPEIALCSWRVLAGGNGYDYTALREGADAAGLRDYLSQPA